MLTAFQGKEVQLTSEPRLREQDFGNFQNADQMQKIFRERQKFGRFYFRFPNGEAGTDVYDRVCDFWGTFYRYMDGDNRSKDNPFFADKPVENVVIVAHGLLMRIFCMVYFKWTVQEFEQVWNPSNCEMWVLERQDVGGRYELKGRWSSTKKYGTFTPIKFGADKNQRLFEHMKTPQNARYMVAGSRFEECPDLAHLALTDEIKKSLALCIGEDCELDVEYMAEGALERLAHKATGLKVPNIKATRLTEYSGATRRSFQT